jgi:hypothetical protein
MRFPSYDRWMSLGGLVASLCGSAAFGWYIYVLQSNGKTNYWSWLSITLITATGVGITLFAIGFFKRKDSKEKSSPADRNSASKSPMRIGYDIADDAYVHSRRARIRNQGTAFKVRDRGRLKDEDSDIA